ncbi:GntR family transcriptional regulator [uncultured Vagococcus sp.]|uniref:GntR family transcriptional regulator n=1 Tax=uncultured Vagococcus sp. TaxID=189676 RepID=UPI0028D10011|nr:GntR family transcriptional regulator [uncultured Vagococcus sp.]
MIIIDKSSMRPYYEQIILGIKEDILHGIYLPGEKIPSVREMASLLLMNPNTVSKAYKALEEQEVIITVRGKGTFVNKVNSQPDQRQLKQLKQNMSELVIEALYLNLSEADIKAWVTEAAQSIGGHHETNKFK